MKMTEDERKERHRNQALNSYYKCKKSTMRIFDSVSGLEMIFNVPKDRAESVELERLVAASIAALKASR